MAPVVRGLAKEYDGRIDFVYLDVADSTNAAMKATLGFRATPHFFFLRSDGSRVTQFKGVVPRDSLTRTLDQLLAVRQ